VPACVPLLLPPLLPPPHAVAVMPRESTQSKATPYSNCGRHGRRCCFVPVNTARPNVPEISAHTANGFFAGGQLCGCVKLTELAAVITVTVAVEADVPVSLSEPGDTEHVDCAGAPLQLSATVWLNPPPGATETV
jgi:hypothetical protein